jgi:hypothetical protein
MTESKRARNAHKIFVEKAEMQRPLQRYRSTLKNNNTKMNFKI